MKKAHLFALLGLMALASCKKENDNEPVRPAPVPIPIEAKPKLKSFIVASLPSPYFGFTYGSSGAVKSISFASDFFRYSLEYDNTKLIRMVNIINGDFLNYTYDGTHVSAIDAFNGLSSERQWHYDFLYDAEQLVRIRWYRIGTNETDSSLERRAELTYGIDGNLSGVTDFRRNENDQFVFSSTTTYADFDTKTNVEDFGLLKDFFDHLLYLPGVKLQANNPRTSHIIGGINEYEIHYEYTYDKDQPQAKTSRIKQVKGADAGRVTIGTTRYVYY